MDKCLNKLIGANTMNFVTHNQRESLADESNGSSLVGTVDASYREICSLFGKPMRYEEGKVDVMWVVKFSDDTVATVYNWKDGKAYLGEKGADVKDITEWCIGGFSPSAPILVQLTLELMREAKPKDKVEEAFSPAFDMMNSIKSTKGESYANLVQIAMLTIKRRDLMMMLMDLASAATDMPKSVKDLMLDADSQMCVKTISCACDASGNIFSSQEKADELMEWAQRIIEAEADGVGELVKGKHK